MKPWSERLRKAAILVATLDRRSADALLEQLSPADAQRVRDAVLELDALDPAEQEAVLREFLGRSSPPAREASPRSPAPTTSALVASTSAPPAALPPDPAVELELSSAASDYEPPPATAVSRPAPRFQFLRETPPARLAQRLVGEHPQTLAIVLAHLEPTLAATVLGGWPASLRVDVLQRVAELEEADPDVLAELEAELEAVLADRAPAPRELAGLSTASAILDAIGSTDRAELLAQLSRRRRDLASRLGEAEAAPRGDWATTSFAPAAGPPPTASSPAAIATQRTRRSWWRPAAAESSADARSTVSLPAAPGAAPPDRSWTFGDLARLDDRALARVLHACDKNLVLLALTGAERKFVERLLKQLPAQQARRLARQMERGGPLRLRDVEQAQAELAATAARLAAQGELAPPRRRPALAA